MRSYRHELGGLLSVPCLENGPLALDGRETIWSALSQWSYCQFWSTLVCGRATRTERAKKIKCDLEISR